MSSPSSVATDDDSLHVVDEVAQVRPRDLGQAERRQVRPPELEHARAQPEQAAVGAHVAELHERQHEAASCRAREAGDLGDVAQRERRVLGVERADDREAALQRLHEVGLALAGRRSRRAVACGSLVTLRRLVGGAGASRTSASIAAVARRSRGSRSSWIASIDQRLACTATLTAAITVPSRSWIGAASARSPSSNSWSTSAKPCADPAQLREQRGRLGDRRGHDLRELQGRERGREPLVALPRDQHAPERGREGGVARADGDLHRHQALRRLVRDVDDVAAVEDRDRRRLAHVRHELAQVRTRERGQRQAREVRPAELEHARAEAEQTRVGAHVAEIDERQHEAARGGGREIRRLRDVAQRERGVLGIEGADHREPALQRLDEAGIPLGAVLCHPGGLHAALPGAVTEFLFAMRSNVLLPNDRQRIASYTPLMCAKRQYDRLTHIMPCG